MRAGLVLLLGSAAAFAPARSVRTLAPAPTRTAPLRAFFDAEKEDAGDVPFDVEARAVGRWLTRPFSEYSGEEGFNVFLAVFHGYCFYEAATKGAFPWLFTGFSFFDFIRAWGPGLSVWVILVPVSKARRDATGVKSKPPPWAKYRTA